MATKFNSFELVGNTGKDGKFEADKGANGMGQVSVAFNASHQDEKGQWVKGKTSWFLVKGWGKVGEKLGQLKKGQRVRVTGHLVANSWSDGKGGMRFSTDLVADNVELVERVKVDNSDDDETTTAEMAKPAATAKAKASKATTASKTTSTTTGKGIKAAGAAAVAAHKQGKATSDTATNTAKPGKAAKSNTSTRKTAAA